MSLRNDKREVFNQLKLYSSLSESDFSDNNNSINLGLNYDNNSKDPLAFLMDLTSGIFGSFKLKEIVNTTLNEVVEYEEPIKASIGGLLTSTTSNQTFSDAIKTNGITLSLKDLDMFNLYKTNPSSFEGSLLYGSNTTNNFDINMFNVLQLGTGSFNDLNFTFNETSNTLTIKLVDPTTTVNDFISQYLSNTTLFNITKINAEIVELLLGGIDFNKSKTELLEEEEINSFLNNTIEKDMDDSAFSFESLDYDKINKKAEERKNKTTTFDFSCGYVNPSTDETKLNNFFNQTASAESYEELLESSLPNDGAIDPSNPLPIDNRNALKDDFNKSIVKKILFTLLKHSLLTPQMYILLVLMIYNNTGTIPNKKELILLLKNKIKCIFEEIKEKIINTVFNFVKANIVKIIKPVLLKIAEEKLGAYKGVLNSLLSKFKQLQ